MAIGLKMFLTTPATNCSAERSFSTLKRVKNYLRSTVTQERLVSLAVLAIEHELTTKLDFSAVVDDFSNARARKKKF